MEKLEKADRNEAKKHAMKDLVKAGERADLRYEVPQHQGRKAKQNNVTVEVAPIKP